jgi:protein MpaA
MLILGWFRAAVNAGAGVFVCVAACSAPEAFAPARAAPALPADSRRSTGSLGRAAATSDILGHSVEGRPIECHVFGTGSRVILILATIHGNEWAGTPLLAAMAGHLRSHAELLAGRRVVLVPVANPDGFAARRRHNVRGVDLNRNFPADNRKDAHRHGRAAVSEPESLAIVAALKRFRPERVVSIHQPIGCIDFDGPGADLARAMAEAGGLPVRRLGARPGSLGAYLGEMLGIPVINVELPGGVARLGAAALWERYGRMMLVAVTHEADPAGGR